MGYPEQYHEMSFFVMTPLLCTTYVVRGPGDGLVLPGVQPGLHRAEDVPEVGGDHGLDQSCQFRNFAVPLVAFNMEKAEKALQLVVGAFSGHCECWLTALVVLQSR